MLSHNAFTLEEGFFNTISTSLIATRLQETLVYS